MKFNVIFTASASYETQIEAESREEAIELAYEEANEFGEPDWQFDWCEDITR